MGICIATEDSKRSGNLEKELRKFNRFNHKIIKILLLGPGESGKSTIFKQMKMIQDNGGYTHDELMSFVHIVHSNCISQMRVLVQAAYKEGLAFGSDLISGYAQEFVQIPQKSNIWSRDVGERIIALWADPVIKQIYEQAGRLFQLNETANYFFDECHRFLEDDYCPSEDDVLRARVRTTGIEEAQFFFDRNEFQVVDVGGQRSERRKWIHCFSKVTAVLFVASLSDYDNSLREDNMQNRMEETLALFKEVANSSYFSPKSALILFLNKTDLFAQKIQRVKLSDYFPLFEGGTDYDKAILFLRMRFLELVANGKNPYVHYTCAINKNNIEFVINSVRETLLNIIVDDFVL